MATSEQVRRSSMAPEQLRIICEAELAWRVASAAYERAGLAKSCEAEQDAWDVYAQLCDEAQICLQPSCFVNSPAHAWCREHDAK